jgi:hypothetical protein
MSADLGLASGDLLLTPMPSPFPADDLNADEELWALYVRASWLGQAVGARTADGGPERPAYLWVLRGNRTIAFSREHGFAEDRRDANG